MDINNQNDRNSNKNNLNALNYAINKNINPSDFYSNNNKNNNDNIIIKLLVILITLILIISIVIGVVFTFKTSNKANEIDNTSINNQSSDDEDISSEQKVINNTINEDSTATLNRKYGRIEIAWVDKNNNIISKPLAPVLNGMQAVSYKANDSKFVKVTNTDSQWYDYSNHFWANAIDDNGSYFVWIPRYAYKIIYYSDNTYTKEIGYCDYRGLLKLNSDNKTLTKIYGTSAGLTEIGNHYILAPAFMKDTASGYNNGGWDANLQGIWVAKYETSMEVDGKNTETSTTEIGNVSISNLVKAVSKPGLTSWRNITINNSYLNSYNYNRNQESHMIKNSEWGALVYLAYSKYGLNGSNISVNKNNKYITGGSESEADVYLYNTNQSTTGNSTGVYDLAGGAWEYIAGYISNGYWGLKTYGGTTENDLFGTGKNSKYKTVYSHAAQDQGGTDYNSSYSMANYLLSVTRRGEALLEVSTSGFGNDGWNNNSAFYVQQDIPFFMRGGDFNSQASAGLFSYTGVDGQTNASQGYRIVLAKE